MPTSPCLLSNADKTKGAKGLSQTVRVVGAAEPLNRRAGCPLRPSAAEVEVRGARGQLRAPGPGKQRPPQRRSKAITVECSSRHRLRMLSIAGFTASSNESAHGGDGHACRGKGLGEATG